MHSNLKKILILSLCVILLCGLFIIIPIIEGLPEDTQSPNKSTGANDEKSELTYNPLDLDTTYHASFVDTTIDASSGFAFPTYYEPGSYRYQAKEYVPNYTDSIYMSSLTGESQTTPLYDISAGNPKGFCFEGDSKMSIEAKCNTLPEGVCSSTNCCVLLGGQKCVSGDQYGPAVKSNFADRFIVNRDYYYYLGKCYGNCPSDTIRS